MTEDEYWTLVDAARTRSGSPRVIAERLRAALQQLPAAQVFAFLEVQQQLMERSYRSDLWGAAYIINGGCSDDGFDDFRGWLFAQGRDVFERALQDPDSLADLDVKIDEAFCDAMIEAGLDAYLELTGDYPTGLVYRYPALDPSPDFEDEREMRARYPRLTARRR